jgi:trimethylamine:corrinoid methyltransferase-like protein
MVTNNDSYEQWLDDGGKSGEQVGIEEAKRQLAAHAQLPMSDEVSQALDEFVET